MSEQVDFGLVDRVIDQMKSDIDANDWTSIEALITHIEPEFLRGFLSDQHSR